MQFDCAVLEMANHMLTMSHSEVCKYLLDLLGDNQVGYIEKLATEISRRTNRPQASTTNHVKTTTICTFICFCFMLI